MSQSSNEHSVDTRLPLSTLLSQVLIAFTIEFDNEFEQRMPHRTTKQGPTPGLPHALWLVSLVMWCNCMRFVNEKGITVSELRRLARTETNLDGMRRWGYIHIEPDITKSRSKGPRQDATLRATTAGQQARDVWQPLFGVIEERWHERFGKQEIARLSDALWAIANQFDIELPDCMPILKYGLFSHSNHVGADRQDSKQPHHNSEAQSRPTNDSSFNSPPDWLYMRLARVLQAFAIEFEQEANISLALYADTLRVLTEHGIPMKELPGLGGVSKEAVSMAMNILQERHMAVIEPDPAGSRFNIVRLTPKGVKIREQARQLLDTIEERWNERFGEDTLDNLRQSLERLVGVPTPQQSPLFKGLQPYPNGWRAQIRQPQTLPHFPMVLHRGGFPDGS